MGSERYAQSTAGSSELIVLQLSGGGGGDPPVHLLLFADFLCVAGAGAIEN